MIYYGRNDDVQTIKKATVPKKEIKIYFKEKKSVDQWNRITRTPLKVVSSPKIVK
jgi:hypothetical protein